MSLAFVLSRMLGLVREQVLYAHFPLGTQIDAYALAFAIPDQIFILVSGGALGAAFIPVFTQIWHSGDEELAWRMASGVFICVAVTVIILAGATWVFAPILVRDGVARHAPIATQDLTVQLMRILLLSPVFLSIASLATSILQSFDRFVLPAIAPVIYNLCIIFGILFLAPRYGIYGGAVGVVVGSAIFCAVQVPSVIGSGFRLRRTWPLKDRHVRRTIRLLLPRIAGQSAVQLNVLVALYLAAQLGDGEVAAFRAASVLLSLPVGLFATSMSTAVFPSLSRMAADGDSTNFLVLLRRSIRGVLFFVVPASVGLMVLREPIVSLVYEYGAFTPNDTLLVARPLLYFSIGLWAFALVDLLPRAFYAIQDSMTPLKITCLVVGVDAALSFILVRPMGIAGLALAFASGLMLQVILLTRAMGRRAGNFLDPATLGFIAKVLIASALMLAALWTAHPILADVNSMPKVVLAVRVGFIVHLGIAVYFIASFVMKQHEVIVLWGVARMGYLRAQVSVRDALRRRWTR